MHKILENVNVKEFVMGNARYVNVEDVIKGIWEKKKNKIIFHFTLFSKNYAYLLLF